MGTPGLSIAVYHADPDERLLRSVLPIYAEVYAEPPYREGPAEVRDFAGSWPKRASRPGFRLVLATATSTPVGFSFGYRLPADTGWWEGQLDPLPQQVTREYEGRTFAVIELAVLAPYRRHGIGRALHQTLLGDRSEERVTLLTRPEPEAHPAQAAYASWSYRPLGRLRPFPGAPVYLAMLRDLPLQV